MQEGGSQYGVPPPEMTPFAAAGTGSRAHVLGIPRSDQLQQQQKPGTQQQPLAEAASPISSRPPMRTSNFDELAPAATGGFPDEDALAAAGEEAERGGVTGNRWPREETLALLRIRSEMDATFRDATLKGPLWEDVSRKLAELGYKRSAKKCKEKFENVHKYYKRTKDGRAGRQDGKSYRFFSQLEALHSSGGAATAAAATPAPAPATVASSTPNPPSSSIDMVGSSGRLQPTPLNAIPLSVGPPPHVVPEPTTAGTAAGASFPSGGISFSSNNSSSASDSEEEDTEEGLTGEPRKRKRRGGGGGGGGGSSSRKMKTFFEGLMTQVMERQEAMQQRFLEMIEKREQDRMIREEAWRRQEMARLSREHEMMAQERAMSASRDAAIIAFLQKVTGQTVPVPSPNPAVAPPHPAPQHQAPPATVSASPLPQQAQPKAQPHINHQATETSRAQPSPMEVAPEVEALEVVGASGGSGTDPASSRWPKSEVHSLIKLRSGMESKYQEAGPKGPLWEEISAGMRRLGYNRSAKRCKEKWENINKYFKKVKHSNKKRPEDAKTCPYFHQLDALYRKKAQLGAGSSMGNHAKPELQLETSTPSPTPNAQDAAAAPPAQHALPQPPQTDAQDNGGGGGGGNNNRNRSGSNPDGIGVHAVQVQARNGGHTLSFFDEGASGDSSAKKPEDIVNELMDQQQRQQRAAMDDYDNLEETDSDSMGQEDDDDDLDEDDEKRKMAYQIEYQQRPGVNGTSNGGGNQSAAAAAAAAAAAGSFMAMVQ